VFCFTLGVKLSAKSWVSDTWCAIEEAEQRSREAAALSDAQQKLTQSQAEAQRICSSAEENAQAARELFWRGRCRISNACRNSSSGFEHRKRVGDRPTTNLSSSYGITKVESQLPSRVDDAAQQQLRQQYCANGGRSWAAIDVKSYNLMLWCQWRVPKRWQTE